jgi:biopolymer transport protein ExbB/TolQ
MEWLWVATLIGWLVALAALVAARRLSRRVAQLSEQYWELKYDHGELKTRVRAIAPTPEEEAAARPPVQQSFVPLTSLKRER